MQMGRLRERANYFMLRQDRFPYHQLRDGPALARLDPDADTVQLWELRSGHIVEVRPGDVQLISKQVLRLDLPPPRARQAPESVEGERVTDTDGEPIPDTSSPIVSPALKALMRDKESVADAKARLTDELRDEFTEVNNLNHLGAGDRVLKSGKTVADRFKELSALFDELARLGDVRPSNG